MIAAIEPAALTAQEARDLESLGTVVEQGLRAFHEVTAALSEIHTRRLYRPRTWAAYCRRAFGLGRRIASILAAAAAWSRSCGTGGAGAARKVRGRGPGGAVAPEERREAWQEALGRNGEPTGDRGGADRARQRGEVPAGGRAPSRPNHEAAAPPAWPGGGRDHRAQGGLAEVQSATAGGRAVARARHLARILSRAVGLLDHATGASGQAALTGLERRACSPGRHRLDGGPYPRLRHHLAYVRVAAAATAASTSLCSTLSTVAASVVMGSGAGAGR